jgi:hypothetical protein
VLHPAKHGVVKTQTPSRRFFACKTTLIVSVLLLPCGHASADFDLPILNPVPKVVSVPEDIPFATLDNFARVRDLTIEVRMTRGNMLTDRLIDFLELKFPAVPKRIVLSGTLKQVHVDQLRRISRLEVRYETSSEGLDKETINSLYALGPVRKVIVLDQTFDRKLLESVRQLKFFSPAVRLGQSTVSKEQLGWLSDDKHNKKTFILPPGADPSWIYDLTTLHPLKLEIRTVKNRIDDKLLEILRDLRRAEQVLVVDGTLTVEDARRFARLERFSLKVELSLPARIIPGLVRLLNRIAPP